MTDEKESTTEAAPDTEADAESQDDTTEAAPDEPEEEPEGGDLAGLSKAELKEKARELGLAVSGNVAELIERIEGAGDEGPKEPVAASRQSVNTWWCGVCDSGNRVGAQVDPVCGNCGTPLLVESEE